MNAPADPPSLAVATAPLATGGGCAAKMGPGQLASVLARSGLRDDPPRSQTLTGRGLDILVGLQTGDDAAVIRLSDDLALVQTVDFFTPVVADPETFGAIAAANAMSDVFAMGGEVMTALSILAVPEGLDPEVAAAILRGAAGKVAEGGGQIVGGHTIHDPQVTFGLAVTGRVHPDRFWVRTSARPGDVLVLTKPLGTALLMTADRAGFAASGDVTGAVDSMLRLNRRASTAARQFTPSAATDVTGFGLLGHLAEMAAHSGVGAEIVMGAVPALDGALAAGSAGCLCGGLHRNRDYWLRGAGGDRVGFDVDPGINWVSQALLWDPQTSGGLLLSVPADRIDAMTLAFHRAGEPLWRIGRVTREPGIRVKP
ncbi:MAG: Selenide,water dikinase @ selenocysteine-containing [uncultured Thermomicrobiales bacterium]|uniref:Selenide, water dikinase n=1 Tax=uncultured Thermomicrobiales bacterium TaxID=1645740 RepID=A0A6J4V6H9_9BACT|nr:MAG: Selenide,water dikinase @ selenocysteine-containing [uncultured Thermomicrobiales bacterium]